MNETEAHRVKRDLQLNAFFCFMAGCLGCSGAYLSKDGFNLIAGFAFLLSFVSVLLATIVITRDSEEVKEDG